MGLFDAEARERRHARLERARERQFRAEFARHVQAIPGLKVTDTTITYRGNGGPLAGARAHVETAGDVDRRVTATRLMLTGPLALAWRKQRDHRELYLTVEGEGFAFVIPLDADAGLSARRVAAEVNARAAA